MRRLLKSKIFLILLFIPFLEPSYFSQIPNIHTIFNVSKVISLFIIFILYILYSINNKISPVIILISLFQLSFFISTLINNGDYWKFFTSCGAIIALCMLVDMAVRLDALNLLESLFILLSTLVYINFFTIILFPNGLYQDNKSGFVKNWFLGYDNSFAPILFPALCIALLCSYFKKKQIDYKTFFFIAIFTTTYLITWSGGGLIGTAMIAFFVIFLYNHNHYHIFNFFNYVLLNIIYFFAVIILRLQNYFSFIIVDILHKDLTFTGRTFIWNYAIADFLKKPMLGNGIKESFHSFIPDLGFIRYVHAHNDYLDILYIGGIVAFCLYAVLIFIIGKKLIKYNTNCFSNILSFIFFTFFVMFQNEAFRSKQLFCALMVISYHLDKVIVQQKIYEIKKIIHNYSSHDTQKRKKFYEYNIRKR